MPIKKIKLVSDTNMFGTTVSLQSKDKSYSVVVGENLKTNPLKNMAPKFEGGYMFRSPNIPTEEWLDTLKSLGNLDGKYNLQISLDTEKDTVTSVLRVAEKDDAAMFAWTNVDVWQKWSEEKELEANKTVKAPKIKVGKDGKITATVTVTTLGDHSTK